MQNCQNGEKKQEKNHFVESPKWRIAIWLKIHNVELPKWRKKLKKSHLVEKKERTAILLKKIKELLIGPEP